MEEKYDIIAINGLSRSGKDTLCDALVLGYKERGRFFKKVKLADELKRQFDEKCLKDFGISAFTENTNDKSIIRPILVEGSKKQRAKSNGSYFFMKAMEGIRKNQSQGYGSIISDLRYMEFPEDEAFLTKRYGGKIITLLRDDVPPANKEEQENFPKIMSVSDLIVKSSKVEDACANAKALAREIIENLKF